MAYLAWLRKPRTLDNKVEIIAAILLALATICSAWCVYEATRWNGVQSVEQATSNALRSESVRQTNIALTLAQVDVELFTDWVTAVANNETQLAEFTRDRFRPEFVPAFEAWLAQVPSGEIPPGTPFTLPEYQLATQVESERLLDQALNATQASREANQIGDNFILTTVLFASVLFLAGIQSKLKSTRTRLGLLIVAVGIFIVGFIILLSLPVNVGF